MIKFYCKHCGQQIGVPEGSAGGGARCPKCKKKVIVPEAESAEPVADQSNISETKGGGKYAGFDRALFDIPQEDESASQISNQVGMSKEGYEEQRRRREALEKYQAEQIGKRKLPGFIDVFLYPTSLWGLVYLGICIGIMLFLDTVEKMFPDYLACLFWVLTLIIRIFVVLFMYWYFAECVRDSAEGGLRAPKIIGDFPPAGEMFQQMVDIISCLVIFFGPFFLYVLVARRAGIIFWLLLIYGIFLFPMVLLAFVVFDSMAGLNPRIIYKSISNTFWQYCGLVLLFIAAVLVIGVLGQKVKESEYLAIVVHFAGIYLIFVAAHLLGRFYWKYQEKLKWEVSQ
jgi:DNA-directed RNA polymerase subunit RPC12/RpoP